MAQLRVWIGDDISTVTGVITVPVEVDPEDEINDIQRGAGQYLGGWAVLDNGMHVRLDTIVGIKRFR